MKERQGTDQSPFEVAPLETSDACGEQIADYGLVMVILVVNIRLLFRKILPLGLYRAVIVISLCVDIYIIAVLIYCIPLGVDHDSRTPDNTHTGLFQKIMGPTVRTNFGLIQWCST